MQRVKRSEAPGYYDVVKNPMDLGTMHKKLQKGAYPSSIFPNLLPNFCFPSLF